MDTDDCNPWSVKVWLPDGKVEEHDASNVIIGSSIAGALQLDLARPDGQQGSARYRMITYAQGEWSRYEATLAEGWVDK